MESNNSTNQIKTLIISNVAETYYRTYKKANPQQAEELTRYDFLEAERAAFYTGDNKAIITSVPIDTEFLVDLKQILGYRSIINLHPASTSCSICSDILKDRKLLAAIETIIRQNPKIDIIPYYATEEFFDLLTFFKQKNLKFTIPETVSSKNRFIRDHYNCKVGFRKLWDKATDENSFVKIPDGFIVDDLAEALDAAWWFYQNKTDFVMKYNRGVSGFGVVFYHCKDLPRREREFKKYLREKHKERIWFEESFVVEEFIDVDKEFYGGSPSVEFKVNSGVRHQYNCLQRLGKDSYFEGILISKKAEEELDTDLERVVENCLEFGEALQELGYRGIFDIDLVVDKKHNVFAVEANLRRTGGTHIFETAQYLFGKNFEQKTVVVSRDNLLVNKKIKTYKQLRNAIQHLYFSKEKKEGVIPTITSFLTIGKLGFIIFAKTIERAKEIEEKLVKTVS